MINKLNILLVDDHEVVQAGFKMLLSSYEQFDRIDTANSGEEAIQLYRKLQPDIVVMDISMPGIGGLEAIRKIVKTSSDAMILVYSIHDSAVYTERALQAGARGFINKNSAANCLAEAILSVSAGNIFLDKAQPTVDLSVRNEKENTNPSTPVELLSPKEFDVFCLLAKGLNGHEISANMCLGYKTIANYSTRIKNKLNANTTVELTHIALASGVLKV